LQLGNGGFDLPAAGSRVQALALVLRSTCSAAAWTLVHSHQRWHSKAAWGTARRLVLGQQARRVWETQASIFFLAMCTGCLILQGEGR